MIWLALAALGIPLWTVACALGAVALRARTLGRRPDDLAVRVSRSGSARSVRGHALWVHDVLVFNRTMALWSTVLVPVAAATPVGPHELDERRRQGLRRLRDPLVVRLLEDGGSLTYLASENATPSGLLGPFSSSPHATDPARPATPWAEPAEGSR